MSMDNVLSIISGCMCNNDGVGFMDKVKESVSKVASKVTSKVPAQAKTAAAMTPQGQAVMAAQAMMDKQGAASPSSTVMPATSVIPSPGKIKGKTGNIVKQTLKKKVFGVPVVVLAIGGIVGIAFLRKRK